jgi:hypothetical protein
MIEYSMDVLIKNGLAMQMGGSSSGEKDYALTPKGREFIVRKGIAF